MNIELYFAVPILHEFISDAESGRLCRHLAESGYAGVEPLVDDHFAVHPLDVRNFLGAWGLAISSLRTGGIYERSCLSLSDPDDKTRSRAVLGLKEAIGYAHAVGSPRVAVGLMQGRLAPGDTVGAAKARVERGIRECAAYAWSYGVELDLEPLNRSQLEYNNTAREVASLIERVGEPSLRMLLDTFHMSLEEGSIEDTLLTYAPLIGYVHLSDTERRCPGAGDFDFERLLQVLDRVGYSGPLTVECDPGASPGSTAAAAAAHLASAGARLVGHSLRQQEGTRK